MKRAVVGALLLVACGDDRAPEPVVVERGGVRVAVWEAPARVQVTRVEDGEVIFDGLGVEVRRAEAAIETQVGMFKIEDDREAPWRAIETFRYATETEDGVRFALDGGGGVVAIGGDGDVTLRIETREGENRTALRFRCEAGEHFLGLGGQSFDVDHRGQIVPLWVEEDGIGKLATDEYDGIWFLTGRRHSTHTPMPIAYSSRGFGFAVDTDARAIFDLCATREDEVRLETWERALELRLFVPPPGEGLRGAVERVTAWTGRPDLPHEVVFAPWLDAIFGQDEVRRVADRLRAEDIAVSAIWTEDWRGGNDEGAMYVLEEDWRVDRDQYPDFEALAAHLHDTGFRFLTYYNTFTDSEADIYGEALDEGYVIHRDDGTPYIHTGVKFRDASMLDLTNPAAVAWAKDIFREGQALGADGWMADFAEWLPHDAALADGSSALDGGHNRYPVQWAQLNRDLAVERAASDPIGLLVFMRSGWLGSQPLVDVMWAGDQQTDWSEGDGMPSVIPIGLGLGVTGFPYYGSDIGGYMSQFTTPTTKELWFRWCTLGALSPVMRTHHGRSARDNWSWERDPETIAHLRRWSKIHMQLVPYLAAMAAQASETGAPIMRPVAFEHPDAGDWAWTTRDEYLLGDRVLVAPVVVEGATSRAVELPAGRWYPLLGGEALEGGTHEVAAAMTEIPAFVAGGSILLLYPDTIDTVVPAAPPAVVSTDVDLREVVLFSGEGPYGSIAEGAATYTWTGRDPALPAPSAATFEGADVAVQVVDGEHVVDVVGAGTLVFEGGGTLVVDGTSAALRVHLRR